MANEDLLRKALVSLNTPPSRPKTSFIPTIKPAAALKFAPPKPIRIFRPKVFVSFDFENDVHYKRLLEAWSANKRFEFIFQDLTPQEIQSSSVSRVKAVLTTKLTQATHTLVLVGKYADQLHADRAEIGYRNWINFEVAQSRIYKKKLVAVLLAPGNQFPEQLLGSGAKLAASFSEAEIVKALDGR